MAATLTARLRRHMLDVDLELPLDPQAPVTVLFGPSGAGKTTLLRCLAGLDRPEPGSRVVLDGAVWTGSGSRGLPARSRRVGYLFQDHALFPHLSVSANVAYGLHRRPRPVRTARAAAALAATGAGHLADTPVAQLSGGEGQRVALARALAPEPRLLLLDEPLSALDTPTRLRLRAELREILVRQGTPALVVTHDRGEALTLGDRVVVLVAGRLHQVGPAEDVFAHPATAAAARALGVDNLLRGRLVGPDAPGGSPGVWLGERIRVAVPPAEAEPMPYGAEVLLGVRAEELNVCPDGGGPESAGTRLSATVTAVIPEGALYRVELDAGVALTAAVPGELRARLSVGQRVHVTVPVAAVRLVADT